MILAQLQEHPRRRSPTASACRLVTSLQRPIRRGVMLGGAPNTGDRGLMKSCLRALVAFCAWCSSGMLHATEVAICTDSGRAVLELADEAAPQQVASFLRYVDMGYYAGTVFHRVQRETFVQGGGFSRDLQLRPSLPPVPNESS